MEYNADDSNTKWPTKDNVHCLIHSYGGSSPDGDVTINAKGGVNTGALVAELGLEGKLE